jgi:hypothetical protein
VELRSASQTKALAPHSRAKSTGCRAGAYPGASKMPNFNCGHGTAGGLPGADVQCAPGLESAQRSKRCQNPPELHPVAVPIDFHSALTEQKQ